MSKRILDDPNFKKLVKLQNYLSFFLSALVLIFYFSFILILAFNPKLFSILIFSSNFSLGVIYGLSIIIMSIIFTVFYVVYSNLVLDKIRDQLK